MDVDGNFHRSKFENHIVWKTVVIRYTSQAAVQLYTNRANVVYSRNRGRSGSTQDCGGIEKHNRIFMDPTCTGQQYT